MKIKLFLNKYKEPIMYVIFGVLTTLVNLVAFKLFNLLIGNEKYLLSNIIAWVIAVVFAYFTNKLFVFESKSFKLKTVLKEAGGFFAARVFSLVIEEVGLFLFVDVMKFRNILLDLKFFEMSGEMLAKVILAVVVVVLNYIFSKLFIFKKK